MLRFNNTSASTSLSQDIWKVLVYDQFCRDLISPLMNVKDLRSEGVTLHMYVPFPNLSSVRHQYAHFLQIFLNPPNV